MKEYDLAIVGGGILGAAVAYQYQQRHPRASIALLEQEAKPAQHQTGRNSGVIHAGVYYPPGSLKARYCFHGQHAIKAFCREQAIPYRQPGKLIVATDMGEMSGLETLFERCQQNGLSPQWLDRYALQNKSNELQGEAAILVSDTGIVDYAQITRRLLDLVSEQGATIRYNAQVRALEESDKGVILRLNDTTLRAQRVICCAGIMADTLCASMGLDVDFRMVPFRGEYYRLPSSFQRDIDHLIYPVPDPAMPFLGVHLTPMMDGSLSVGPNAVMALGRFAYHKHQMSVTDTWRTLSYPGFWRFARQHWRSGLHEQLNSWCKRGYLKAIQKYLPKVQLSDLKGFTSGIRAQAMDAQGNLFSDFHFVQTERTLHVANAPSPAATSCFPIADAILERLDSDR